ncbi:hypothetical protein H0N95_00605 [Candidatus Micrarchaeota archaeon]|nr:hypothetical protein [Candidatus Micrarchaeota archaeon]
MNNLSFSLLILFGLLLGFVFKDLLKQFGAKDELASSLVGVLMLPFLVFIGFVFVRLFVFAGFNVDDFKSISTFVSSPLLWIAVATLVSGAARFALDNTVWKKKS